MLRKIACLALAASALTGCIIVAKPAGTVEVHGHMEPHGHSYIYLPGYHAYYCTAHDDWWWIDGGRWTYVRTRPSHIHVDVNVAWVHVDNDDGPEPYRRFDDHSRDYPRDWRSVRHAGPPPGRAFGQPAESGPGNRGRGNAYGRDRDGNPGEGADRNDARDDNHQGGSPVPGGGGSSKGRGRHEDDGGARETPAEQESPAGGDGNASGKGASPPKEKDKPKGKDRGRDKDKEKSKGKDPEQKPEKDKDVEKEKEPPENKEQGGNEEEQEKKDRGRKKRGD